MATQYYEVVLAAYTSTIMVFLNVFGTLVNLKVTFFTPMIFKISTAVLRKECIQNFNIAILFD